MANNFITLARAAAEPPRTPTRFHPNDPVCDAVAFTAIPSTLTVCRHLGLWRGGDPEPGVSEQ